MPNRRENGFGLLEGVIAFAIAALALGALFQGAMASLGATTQAGIYQEAISRARSRLESLRAGPLSVANERSGDDGGGFRYHSRTAVLRVGPVAVNGTAATLYGISVDITSSDGRTVRLQTRHVAIASARP